MLANSTAGAGLLARQRYEVLSIFESDGVVAARLTWTGVIAHDTGPFTSGQRHRAHRPVHSREGRANRGDRNV